MSKFNEFTEDLEGEIWKPILNYEDLYEISNLGRVKILPKLAGGSQRSKIYIKQYSLSKFGYCKHVLAKNKKNKTILLHRLVAQAFLPNPNNLPQVNHINGIKTDNRLENLEWCTHNYNIQHSFDNQLNKQRGTNHRKAKLTEKEVLEIIESKETSKILANRYNVYYTTIGKIKRGENWRFLIQIKKEIQ